MGSFTIRMSDSRRDLVSLVPIIQPFVTLLRASRSANDVDCDSAIGVSLLVLDDEKQADYKVEKGGLSEIPHEGQTTNLTRGDFVNIYIRYCME